MGNKFLLSGPFADELMIEVEHNLLKRGYTHEELSYESIPVEYDLSYDASLPFNELIKLSDINLDNRIKGKDIKSRIKKLLFKIFKWYFIPVFNDQIKVNEILFFMLNQTYNELLTVKKQINNLKDPNERSNSCHKE